jgi:hypothetical protein
MRKQLIRKRRANAGGTDVSSQLNLINTEYYLIQSQGWKEHF